MKVFLIQIGRETRRGGFQELHSRCVQVPDEADDKSVRDYYRMYKGFAVIVKQAEVEDITSKLPVSVSVSKPFPGERGSLAFKIKYNKYEAALHKKYSALFYEARRAEGDIERSVRERYEKLPYTIIDQWYDMQLTTDVNGTYCKKLSIASDDFFRVIKDCDDGTAELEITPGVNNDSDIPY